MTVLQRHLDAFLAAAEPYPNGARWTHHHDGGEHGTHLVFGSMVHGNEVGSLPAAARLVEELVAGTVRFGGRVTVFVGNPEAGLADRRFLDTDLNRVFHDNAPDDHEGRRARVLMPILDDADVFIDFHQTILETRQSFWICPWQPCGWRWIRALAGAKVWVTRAPTMRFSAAGTVCADEYVRRRGLPGLTLELSRKGFADDAAATAYRVMRSALALADDLHRGKTTLDEAAAANPDVAFLHTVHREEFDDAAKTLRDGFANFDPVKRGDVVSAPGTPEMLAPADGWVLFPKYPDRVGGRAVDPRPEEIYRVIQELPEHPRHAWGDE